MPATLIRLGYGEPVNGVYPAFFDLAYPVWQFPRGVAPMIRHGQRLSKTPVAGGTLVQRLGQTSLEHDISLLYRPRLRPFTAGVTPLPWDLILDNMMDELLEQAFAVYWGDRLQGRFVLDTMTWQAKDAGYSPDTNATYGGFFGREVDVRLKITKLLDA